jgi:methionine-rich copper-binding protein CopC
MNRERRFVNSVLALSAAGAIALVIIGCAFPKPGSLSVSQPTGIGSARVHFALCTISDEDDLLCGENDEDVTVQYLVGIAAPVGSVPPETFTAAPVDGASPIVFTRNEEVSSEVAAASASLQKSIAEDPEAVTDSSLVAAPWPPAGLQGFGYISAPVQEFKGQTAEWSVNADFGIPTVADGSPYPGPFAAGLGFGFRFVSAKQSSSRPVHCARLEEGVEPKESDAFCAGSFQIAQFNTADLRIGAPAKPIPAFVGGSPQISFPLEFAGGTPPAFALSATTTAKGGKVKVGSKTFTPAAPDPTSHLSPDATGKVTVTLPPKIKPGTYSVTLTAVAPQGGSTTGTAKIKVTKPKLKFGSTKVDAAKGTATLKVTVPGAGTLTIKGKGVKTVKKKAKKKKTLKVKIVATGSAAASLGTTGSAKVKIKAVFKPTSGISASKKKSVALELR